MRIATWNVNGVQARLQYILRWLAERKPDLIGLQKIRVREGEFPARELAAPRGTDAADLDPLEVWQEVERRGTTWPSTKPRRQRAPLIPDAELGELALAAPRIGNTLIQWTIGN